MPFFISSPGLNGETLLSPSTARTCPTCGIYTHPWEDRGDLKTKITKDWSTTNDGFQIVSEKFKSIVEYTAVKDIDFFPLSNGSYVFRPRRVVFLDVTEAVERVKDRCTMCGRLTAFLGIPFMAKTMPGQKKIGLTEIVRAGQQFGGGDLWHDLVIFGDEIHEALKEDGLKGNIFWYPLLEHSPTT